MTKTKEPQRDQRRDTPGVSEVPDPWMHPCKFGRMSAIRGRATRKAVGVPSVLLQGRVSVEARDAAHKAADELGISIAAYLDALVLADAVHQIVPRDRDRDCQEALAI
jgi:hypothetical protein